MNDNIILIGMPSSGKSTLGQQLAKALGYHFLDTDDVIREQNGCELSEIIGTYGIPAFKEREEKALCSVAVDHTVIATGGSAVYSEKGMRHLGAIGTVVYLYTSYETVAQRVGDPKARGVVMPTGFTLRDLYNERAPLYEKYAAVILKEQETEREEETLRRLTEQFKPVR